MLALFGGFPIWWALGLSAVICILFAVPMLAWLLARGRVRVPKGFGLWLAFLFWMLLSATQLDEARRWYAFSYRGVLYLSMTVMFVYVYNLPRSAMPTRRIVLALALFWAAVIGFGFAALAAPNFQLTTPVSLLLPSSAGQQPVRPGPVQPQAGPGPDLHRLRPDPAGGPVHLHQRVGRGGRPAHPDGPGRPRPGPLLPGPQRHPAAAGRLPGPDRDLGQPRAVGRPGRRAGVRGRPGGAARQRQGAAWPSSASSPWPPPWSPSPRWTATSATGWPTSTATSAARASAPRRSPGRWSGPCSATAGRGSRPRLPNAPDIGTHGQVYLVIFSHGHPGPGLLPRLVAVGAVDLPPGAPPGRPCGAT